MVVPRLELAALRESAAAELGLVVQDWVDGENPYDIVAVALGGHARVAVTDSMPALHLLPLAERLGAVPVLGTGDHGEPADGQGPSRGRRAAHRPARRSTGCTPGCRSS